MLRYHRQVYFKPSDTDRLKDFTDRLNGLAWQYTAHSLDNIKYRIIDVKSILLYIKDLILNSQDIFEFYTDEKSQDIIKTCFRINYNKAVDLILIIGKNKQIITIYINSTDDKHFTLKRELYQRC
jgi:hypothetical protein